MTRQAVRAALIAALLLVIAAVQTPGISGESHLSGLGQRSGRLEMKPAWYGGEQVRYWDFGVSLPKVADLFRAIHGLDEAGAPRFVSGEDPIFDVIPGQADYTDFWKMNFFVVDEGFIPNLVKSFDAVRNGDFRLVDPELVVNCPVVAANTVAGQETLHSGWYRGEMIHYFDFGKDVVDPTATGSNVYFFVEGFGGDGSPIFLDKQNPVIDSVPGDPGYSALRRVNYVVAQPDSGAGRLRSATAVLASGLEIRVTENFMNLPQPAQAKGTEIPVGAWWIVPGLLSVVAIALFYRALRGGKRVNRPTAT